MGIKMKVIAEIKDNYILMRVKGTPSVENISPFEIQLSKHVENKSDIIIDLADLTFIDSSSLGIIVVYFTKSEKNNNHFALINVNHDIMQMFKITGLDKRIKIFDSLNDALNKLELN